MTLDDEAPQQNAPMATQNDQSNEFDINDIHFPRVMSDDSAPSTASTIYDPAVLAVSPEYRAIVEKRHKQFPFNEDQVEQTEVPLHVSTPAARKPGEMRFGEAMIRLPEEAEEESEEERMERELCCHGLLPLFTSLMVFNMINIVIGLACIIIGTAQFDNSSKDVVGFGSAARLVITGSYLLAIFSLVLGSLFILCGFLGAAVNYMKAYMSPKSGRAADLVYHCLLFLVTLICIVIFGLNVYSMTVRQSGPVYDTELWKEFVRSDSRHLCSLEKKHNCAAMNLGQCLSEKNETRYTFCPGHFCIDFCRIATDDVSLQPICASCREDALESIPVFVECKSLEAERSDVQTCEGPADEELDRIYGRLFIIAVTGFAWILLVWAVIGYVECFL